MLSKQANQFIIELKMYLMSKGKNDQEINVMIDELSDHLLQAEMEKRKTPLNIENIELEINLNIQTLDF